MVIRSKQNAFILFIVGFVFLLTVSLSIASLSSFWEGTKHPVIWIIVLSFIFLFVMRAIARNFYYKDKLRPINHHPFLAKIMEDMIETKGVVVNLNTLKGSKK